MITADEFAEAWAKLEREAPVLRILREQGHPQTLDTLSPDLQQEALKKMGIEPIRAGSVLIGYRRVEAPG